MIAIATLMGIAVRGLPNSQNVRDCRPISVSGIGATLMTIYVYTIKYRISLNAEKVYDIMNFNSR